MTRRRLVATGLIAALITLFASTAFAAQKSRRFGAAVGPVRLVPQSDIPVTVRGLHAYFGTIELGSEPDGLVVIDRLSLERYLLGLQEVPPDWPREALRAQAVAARTYALWTLRRPPAGAAATYGFDICASVQCQVFSGADVVRSKDGPRWAAAVSSTAGRAVLYRGRPILARYHSTSGGRTLENTEAFPEERSYPYLQPVESPSERGSPLYRWRVTFRLRALEAMLERGGLWDRARGRLEKAFTIPSRSDLPYPDVVLRGSKGRTVATAQEVRETVGVHAPALFPSRYPSRWRTVSGILPETLPSNRVDVATRAGVVTVAGRGWGHGVGMSQWGAHGLAMTGATHEEILGHYYTGTTVGTTAEPGSISVGVTWGEPSVAITGAFEIVDGRGRTLAADALGTWQFRPAGPGVVKLVPPKGYPLPLQIGVVDAPSEVAGGQRVRLTVALSRAALVRVTSEDEVATEPSERVVNAGRRSLTWVAPEEPGLYRVQVEASAGAAGRRTDAVDIEVVGEAEPAETPAGDEAPDGSIRPLVLLIAGLIGLAGVILARKMGS